MWSLGEEREDSRSTRDEEVNDCRKQQRRERVSRQRGASYGGKPRQLNEMQRGDTLSFYHVEAKH